MPKDTSKKKEFKISKSLFGRPKKDELGGLISSMSESNIKTKEEKLEILEDFVQDILGNIEQKAKENDLIQSFSSLKKPSGGSYKKKTPSKTKKKTPSKTKKKTPSKTKK